MHITRSSLHALLITAAFVLSVAAPARAQGFIAPFAGYNFGGDAECPEIDNCEDKRLNAGLAFGKMGAVFGFEQEFAYTKDFFGDAPGLDSSVLTIMSSLMVVPKIPIVRPYFVLGVGLI